MSDEHAERNERLKATMREEKHASQYTGPAQVPCGPPQAKNPPKNPTGHVDPYRKVSWRYTIKENHYAMGYRDEKYQIHDKWNDKVFRPRAQGLLNF